MTCVFQKRAAKVYENKASGIRRGSTRRRRIYLDFVWLMLTFNQPITNSTMPITYFSLFFFFIISFALGFFCSLFLNLVDFFLFFLFRFPSQ